MENALLVVCLVVCRAFAIYLSRTLVVAVVVLVFSVVGMIMIPFSQLAIAEKYAVHDGNHMHNDAG
jgi:hypothetical protein